jgi:hypothetical protein
VAGIKLGVAQASCLWERAEVSPDHYFVRQVRHNGFVLWRTRLSLASQPEMALQLYDFSAAASAVCASSSAWLTTGAIA